MTDYFKKTDNNKAFYSCLKNASLAFNNVLSQQGKASIDGGTDVIFVDFEFGANVNVHRFGR